MNFKLFLVLLLAAVLLADRSDAWGRRRRSSRRRRSWTLPWSNSGACPITTKSLPYDSHLAKKLMTYSAIAYHKTSDLGLWRCPLCLGNLNSRFEPTGNVSNKAKHLFAYVGYDPVLQAVIMAFRGSDGFNWRNWILVNLNALRQSPSPLFRNAGTVHQGFYSAYLFIRNSVNELVDVAMRKHDVRRLIVTGHSMGAALATLAALDQKVNRRRDVTMMNFGSPRVGDLCFASYYSKQIAATTRVAHALDPVCSSPPKWTGYRHVPNHYEDRSSIDHLSYVGVTLKSKSRKRRSEDAEEDFFADFEDIYAAVDDNPEENLRNPYAHVNM